MRPPADRPRSLEHPLPAGMRDLLPEQAARRRAIARRVLERLELWGYHVVVPPVFEFADVLERGLGALDPADVLRFVEPESGEVAALRPDMTPQIARMIATRLAGRPAPFRLAYEGSVLRRRSGRAHKHRQIPQVGVELAGIAAGEGDLELLEVAAEALRGAGLASFTIDLGDAAVVRALAPDAAAEVVDALARKDESSLEALGAPAEVRALVRLHGGREALVEGVARLAKTPAKDAAARLLAVFDAACARGLGDHLVADLGEVRGFAYYTGSIFHLYAPGPGDAIGSGGRYDELLARFGAPMPAAGFALDLDRLVVALDAAASGPASRVGRERVVVVGAPSDPRVAELRARGVAAVAIADEAAAAAYATAWGFTRVEHAAKES